MQAPIGSYFPYLKVTVTAEALLFRPEVGSRLSAFLVAVQHHASVPPCPHGSHAGTSLRAVRTTIKARVWMLASTHMAGHQALAVSAS